LWVNYLSVKRLAGVLERSEQRSLCKHLLVLRLPTVSTYIYTVPLTTREIPT
jgi:hypothetical protein